MTRDAHFQGRRILVVEDDFFVALTVVSMLEDAGATVIGPINSLEEALALIENDDAEFDVAVIDINLRGKKSYPIADALLIRNVKFTFATGYGLDAIDPAYSHFPRCEKPFSQDVLIQTVNDCLNRTSVDHVALRAASIDGHLRPKP